MTVIFDCRTVSESVCQTNGTYLKRSSRLHARYRMLVPLPVGDFRTLVLISRNALASGTSVGDAKEPWPSAQRLICETLNRRELGAQCPVPSLVVKIVTRPIRENQIGSFRVHTF